jgi:hypothetical protein
LNFVAKAPMEAPKFTFQERILLKEYDDNVRYINEQKQKVLDDEELLGLTPETPWLSERQYKPKEADVV